MIANYFINTPIRITVTHHALPFARAFRKRKNVTYQRISLLAPACYIDVTGWKYRCSTLHIYMQHGGDISPPKPSCKYLSQGISPQKAYSINY
ncbi:hypothetical protein EV202_101135 [Bacteroides heparinolyticus]|uniref:Uncharacterized protein n=1 Tax=Prevotella heparinolytica TaxID=28113 RepID=A0A4R2LVR6_9BACE|nr:hypothetical protein EV202_101135 [Bacteroides heparinolyticus]